MTAAREQPGAPVVSVLTTAYNREGFIAETIESILRSTLDDLELIIVDNNSSDGTVAIAREYAGQDSRVKVHQNETNIGDFPNRNRAASLARGTYLKYVDSDDLVYPHGLEVMVRCMESFSDAGLGLSALADPRVPYPRLLTPAEAYREHFLELDLLSRAPGSTIVRRSAFEAVGGFSGRRFVGDHELWLKLASRFSVVKMPADLVWDRVHTAQEQHRQDAVEKVADREDLDAAALNDPGCPLDARDREAALARLSEKRARTWWQFMRASGGFELAGRYRRRSSVPASAIARIAWERLTP